MSDRKSCIRCQRQIDASARICPFCNWDQTEIPPRQEEAPAVPLYVPPDDKPWRGRILGIVAFASLLIIAFVVGMLIHGIEPSEVKASQSKNTPNTSTMPTTPVPRSNVTLVPATSSDTPQSIEQPITSAPAQTPGQQPNDATALPAEQYAAAAARAKAERAAAIAQAAPIDPRTLTGSVYQPSPHAPRGAKTTVNKEAGSESSLEGPPVAHTQAFPEYKPLPHISVARDMTARLNLTVGPDGRVTDIDVDQPIPEMPRLIAAVQNWRFKPATENGSPVTSRVAVDITFHANE